MSDEQTLEGRQVRRLSDGEPVDYEPGQHISTGRMVSSAPGVQSVGSDETSDALIAELIMAASRVLGRSTLSMADRALLDAARTAMSRLSESIQTALEADCSHSGKTKTRSAKSGGKSPSAKT